MNLIEIYITDLTPCVVTPQSEAQYFVSLAVQKSRLVLHMYGDTASAAGGLWRGDSQRLENRWSDCRNWCNLNRDSCPRELSLIRMNQLQREEGFSF